MLSSRQETRVVVTSTPLDELYLKYQKYVFLLKSYFTGERRLCLMGLVIPLALNRCISQILNLGVVPVDQGRIGAAQRFFRGVKHSFFGKNPHTCKRVLDKFLNAHILAEVKQCVELHKGATTRQIVEPILMRHFEEDPDRNLPVAA